MIACECVLWHLVASFKIVSHEMMPYLKIELCASFKIVSHEMMPYLKIELCASFKIVSHEMMPYLKIELCASRSETLWKSFLFQLQRGKTIIEIRLLLSFNI